MKPRRAYTDLTEIEAEITQAFKTLRAALPPLEDGTDLDTALVTLESFADVALRVMRKTNPSKIQDEARIAEINHRIKHAVGHGQKKREPLVPAPAAAS